jgi:hypothetical protein
MARRSAGRRRSATPGRSLNLPLGDLQEQTRNPNRIAPVGTTATALPLSESEVRSNSGLNEKGSQ